MRKIDKNNAILAAIIAALSAAAVKQGKSLLKEQMKVRLRDYAIDIEDPEDQEPSSDETEEENPAAAMDKAAAEDGEEE